MYKKAVVAIRHKVPSKNKYSTISLTIVKSSHLEQSFENSNISL